MRAESSPRWHRWPGALLAACSLVPEYQRPPLAVADQFPTPTPDTTTGPAAADLDWRQVFTDPRQQRLIDLALQNNRDLRLAALNVEQAQARWQIQHASLWPTVNAGVIGNRQALPNGASLTTYSAGFLVTAYELDFFGRLRALSDAAQAQAVSAEDGRRAAQIALIASVAAVHLSLLADDELMKPDAADARHAHRIAAADAAALRQRRHVGARPAARAVGGVERARRAGASAARALVR